MTVKNLLFWKFIVIALVVSVGVIVDLSLEQGGQLLTTQVAGDAIDAQGDLLVVESSKLSVNQETVGGRVLGVKGITTSPGMCQEGFEGPNINEYVVPAEDLEGQDDGDGVLGDDVNEVVFESDSAKEIVRAICMNDPPLDGISNTTHHAEAWMKWADGALDIKHTVLYNKWGDSDYEVVDDGGLVETPDGTVWIDRAIYPVAPKGKEFIPVDFGILMREFTAENKAVLAVENPKLAELVQKVHDDLRVHELAHWEINEEFLPKYIDLINNPPKPNPATATSLDELLTRAESAFQLYWSTEAAAEAAEHWSQLDSPEHKLIGGDIPIKGWDGIFCAFANEFTSEVWGSVRDENGLAPNAGYITMVENFDDGFTVVRKDNVTNEAILYWDGAETEMTAHAKAGYVFDKWGGNVQQMEKCPCFDSADSACKFTVKGNTACIAEFKSSTLTLIRNVQGGSGSTAFGFGVEDEDGNIALEPVSGTQENIAPGDYMIFESVLPDDYQTLGWTGDDGCSGNPGDQFGSVTINPGEHVTCEITMVFTPIVRIYEVGDVGEGESVTADFWVRVLDADGNLVTNHGGVTFDFTTVDESAIAGSDYEPLSGAFSIPDGTDSMVFNVGIIDDEDKEDPPEEIFAASIENINGVSAAPTTDTYAQVTILDDDGILCFCECIYEFGEPFVELCPNPDAPICFDYNYEVNAPSSNVCGDLNGNSCEGYGIANSTYCGPHSGVLRNCGLVPVLPYY